MKQLESQIAEWRAFVAAAPALDGRDVEELESHLREQINELRATGLAIDEAFLVAVKRMGALDALSREFAREHSDRLWKQLVLSSDEPQQRPAGSWLEAIGFAVGAAVAIQIARLAATSPFEMAAWFPRNLGFFVLPLLAGYLARTRRLDRRGWILTLAPFAVIGVLVNLYPYASRSDTEMLVTLHLPVVLWCALAIPYTGGKLTSHEGRMDFVRFTGEWVIYYTLIALGGAVLMALTALILNPLGSHVVENTIEWVLPSGAAGAVVVAAWLVEEKQQVVENMAPVLTMLFTPLFAVMLTMAAVSYAFSGVATEFDRGLLAVFDALLVVVLGLVVYAMSARDSSRSAGLMDVVQLVAVVSALALDLMVLGSMAVRIGNLGFTPNRVVALGLNVVLLVNLTGAAWLSVRFLRGHTSFHRLERWQTAYLPVLALWLVLVVVVVPPLFSFE